MRDFIYALLICAPLLAWNGLQVGNIHQNSIVPASEPFYKAEAGGEIINFYLQSNSNIAAGYKSILKYELSDAARRKVIAGIKELEATNAALKAIKKKLQQKLKPAEIQSLIREAIKMEYSNSVVQQVVKSRHDDSKPGEIVIGGIECPIPKLPPVNPNEDCEGAGDAVKEDCMNGLNILSNCGIMSAADKVLGQFNCQFAGITEENKCGLANMQGNYHIPTETHFGVDAEIQCRIFEQSGGVNNIPQTQTSNGN